MEIDIRNQAAFEERMRIYKKQSDSLQKWIDAWESGRANQTKPQIDPAISALANKEPNDE